MRRAASSTGFVLFTAMALFLFPVFGHALTLQEGLKIVTENGRDVAIARSDESAAKSAVDLARAPWLPWIDLYGRETWLRYQPEAIFGPNIVPTSQDQYTTYGFKATQLLYDFGKTSSSVSSAQYGLKAREVDTFRTRNRAALDFINSYFDLLEAQELHKVAQEEVTLYEAHVKDATARFRTGVITRNEVLQAEVTLADSQQRLLTAENNEALRISRLNSVLMRPLNEEVHPAEVFGTPLDKITLQDAWAAAEAQNADLRDLEARTRAKDESISSIRGEYLPSIYVSGGYEYNENQYMAQQRNWALVAGVNMSLFAGGSTNAKVSMAKYELLSLRMSREKLLDAVLMEVQAAWLEVQSSQKKIQVALAAVGQAQENLRLQRLRYKEGVGTNTEVLDAVTLLTTAETNSWKANFGLRRAEAALLYAMGRDLAVAYSAL
jgi:outer membrane protein